MAIGPACVAAGRRARRVEQTLLCDEHVGPFRVHAAPDGSFRAGDEYLDDVFPSPAFPRLLPEGIRERARALGALIPHDGERATKLGLERILVRKTGGAEDGHQHLVASGHIWFVCV